MTLEAAVANCDKTSGRIITEKKIVGLKTNLRKIPTKGNNEVSVEEKVMPTKLSKKEEQQDSPLT